MPSVQQLATSRTKRALPLLFLSILYFHPGLAAFLNRSHYRPLARTWAFSHTHWGWAFAYYACHLHPRHLSFACPDRGCGRSLDDRRHPLPVSFLSHCHRGSPSCFHRQSPSRMSLNLKRKSRRWIHQPLWDGSKYSRLFRFWLSVHCASQKLIGGHEYGVEERSTT